MKGSFETLDGFQNHSDFPSLSSEICVLTPILTVFFEIFSNAVLFCSYENISKDVSADYVTTFAIASFFHFKSTVTHINENSSTSVCSMIKLWTASKTMIILEHFLMSEKDSPFLKMAKRLLTTPYACSP